MHTYRIYADFNGLQESAHSAGKVAIHLQRMGSLIDLSRAKLCLYEGLQLNVYSDSDENEDLEAKGNVYFDRDAEKWFVEFDETDIQYVDRPPKPSGAEFPCWHCGSELREQIEAKGLDYGDKCPQCGRDIHEPLRSPGQ